MSSESLAIGRKVAALRKQREMSTSDLAAKAGLSQPQISRLENGRQGFRSATLSRIAEALEVPPSYFFEEERDSVKAARQKQLVVRKNLGRDFGEDLKVQFGELVVTPGYRQLVRRLTASLAREDCDARTLRRLLDRVLSLSDSERAKLLARMAGK